jgi:hypothetical protein
VVLGLAGGIGAGVLLAPASDTAATCDPASDAECAAAAPDGEDVTAPAATSPVLLPGEAVDYVKLNNQFVIPVIVADSVAALVVVSLTLEVTAGSNTAVFDREPRLRDAFLQVLFDFAYSGGFDGPFTQSANLATLRRALRETGQSVIGPTVLDVLIVDIVRQEV